MDARFRVRPRHGAEFTIRSLDEFSVAVASGRVGRDDLVHDALTGDWAPARVHPVYRLVTDPLVRPTGREGGPPSGAVRDAGPSLDAGSSLDPGSPPEPDSATGTAAATDMVPEMQLVEVEARSPEEEARAFLDRMARERQDDPDTPAVARQLDLTDAGARTVVVAEAADVAAEEALAGAGEPVVREARAPAVTMGPRVGPVLAPPRRRRRGRRRAGWVAGGALVVVAAGILAATWEGHAPEAAAVRTAAEGAVSTDRRQAVSNPAVRDDAWDGFVARVEALRREMSVGAVPPGWLAGTYFADAGAYPEVARYWSGYAAFIAEVERLEAGLYRDAFLAALDDRRVTGPVRSLRVAAAVADFDAARADRERVYDRAGELAAAAVTLHDVLVALDGRISWEPAAGGRVSADPVIEAAGADPEAQRRLEAALDRVLVALHGTGAGRGDPEEVPSWIPDGLAELRPGG